MKKSIALIVFIVLASIAFGQKGKTVKIGMCSDVHLPTMHDGKERLTTFLDSMKTAKPDFIIELGDFVTPAAAWTESFQPWKDYTGKKYNVIGNHEMDGGYSLQQAIAFRGMPTSYYTFSTNG